MRERKAFDLHEFTINGTDFRLFSLLPGDPHLPHQREAQIWKPLLFIIQLHFTDDASAGGQGRPPLQNRVCKQRDKLKFTDLSNCLPILL